MQQTQDRQPDLLVELVRKIGKDNAIFLAEWLDRELKELGLNNANGADDLFRVQGVSRWLSKRIQDVKQLATSR